MIFFVDRRPVSAEAKYAVNIEQVATQANSVSGTFANRDKIMPRKVMSGIASWYGMPFHGRKTASGQVFDMNKLTAAHQTLPLFSKILVENPCNGKTVMVTVNDRGPYIKPRVIDLSREAARQLGILARGIAYVNYEVCPADDKGNDGKCPAVLIAAGHSSSY